MLICSFHTGGRYAHEAAALLNSLRRLRLPHHVVEVPDLGSWEANCQHKARFLRELLRGRTQPLLWVDADAMLHADPRPYLRTLPGDIGVHHRKGVELLSGTILLRPTRAATELLARWVAVNDLHPTLPDQQTLDQAIGLMGDRLTVAELPPEYCCIFDITRKLHPGIEPVIEHFQASRRLKHLVGTA